MVRFSTSVLALFVLMSLSTLSTAFGAAAAPKVALLPFEIIDSTRISSPMGYDLGGGLPAGPDTDEVRRLKLITDDLRRRIREDGRYALVGSDALAAEAEKLGPIHKCNGCEDDIAKRAGAGLVLVATVEKLSDLLFNFNLYLRDVSEQKLKSVMSTTIQGSTDEAWLRGVRYLAERKLLPPGDAK
jgi:hypothetical protein